MTEDSGADAHFGQRRERLTLRELLDELLAYTRQLTRDARHMSEKELEHAHQRLEWLADEVWREAVSPNDGA